MAEYEEPGNLGMLISLGGVKGQPGLGRKIVVNPVTIYGVVLIVPTNDKRISLLVTNQSLNDGYIAIGLASGNAHLLRPGGNYQIDANHPSTLPVYGYSTVSSIWTYTEISVQ